MVTPHYCFVSWPVPVSPPQTPPLTEYVPFIWVGAAGLFNDPINVVVLPSSLVRTTLVVRPAMTLLVAAVAVAKQAEPV